jgi:hypothetical protein
MKKCIVIDFETPVIRSLDLTALHEFYNGPTFELRLAAFDSVDYSLSVLLLCDPKTEERNPVAEEIINNLHKLCLVDGLRIHGGVVLFDRETDLDPSALVQIRHFIDLKTQKTPPQFVKDEINRLTRELEAQTDPVEKRLRSLLLPKLEDFGRKSGAVVK